MTLPYDNPTRCENCGTYIYDITFDLPYPFPNGKSLGRGWWEPISGNGHGPYRLTLHSPERCRVLRADARW